MSVVVGNSPSGVAVFTAGSLRVVGTTSNVGSPNTPVRRRVRLHRQDYGVCVAETWSDPVTGAYSFDYLTPGIYFVTAFDHTGQYGGVIESDITPEPMP